MPRVPLIESEAAVRLRALNDVAHLQGLLISVCAWCQKILRSQSVDASCVGISHGLCRRCDERMEREGNLYAKH